MLRDDCVSVLPCEAASETETTPLSAASNGFTPGMYVRVPMDTEDPSAAGGDFRDLRMARIERIDHQAGTAGLMLLVPADAHRFRCDKMERPLDALRRCELATNAHFIHCDTRQRGRVLLPCEPSFSAGKLRTYYVQLDDQVRTLSEADLYVAYNEGFPDAIQQLLDYEFHPPQWHQHRDRLVESYAALQAATFGIEELVGTRIMLLAHQAEVVARVLGDRTCRFLLADEVGLGKTIEACVILKGLRRRQPKLRTLIVVPAALARQWQHELSAKFWLDFSIVEKPQPGSLVDGSPGVIVTHEALADSSGLLKWLESQPWGLLIVDEAHNLRRKPHLYDRALTLSQLAQRSLVLSATPIQRHAKEYLKLLKLMHPAHYQSMDDVTFDRMLAAQGKIRSTIAYLARALNVDDFDAAEFQEEIASVVAALGDPILTELVARVAADSSDHGLAAATDALQYVSENYRIESRVIRNRRASLLENQQIELPKRQVTLEFAYTPGANEAETLVALHAYAKQCLAVSQSHDAALDYAGALFHAAFSSPHALTSLLAVRLKERAPSEMEDVVQEAPPFAGESALLERLVWHARRWRAESDAFVGKVSQRNMVKETPHRLAQVLAAIHEALREPDCKVLVFAAWGATLDELYTQLKRVYGKSMLAALYARYGCRNAASRGGPLPSRRRHCSRPV